jgi:hypothetical protein
VTFTTGDPDLPKKAVVGLLDFDIGLDSDANKLGAVGSHVVLRATGALRRIQDFLTK